jgi:hypothetical protein
MVIKISKNTSKAQIQHQLKKLSRRKTKQGFDPKKYFGKLIRNLDGLEYQKSVRNEWD